MYTEELMKLEKMSGVFGGLDKEDLGKPGQELHAISKFVEHLIEALQKDDRFDWKNGIMIRVVQEFK